MIHIEEFSNPIGLQCFFSRDPMFRIHFKKLLHQIHALIGDFYPDFCEIVADLAFGVLVHDLIEIFSEKRCASSQ